MIDILALRPAQYLALAYQSQMTRPRVPVTAELHNETLNLPSVLAHEHNELQETV
jgi:hypothetical protein